MVIDWGGVASELTRRLPEGPTESAADPRGRITRARAARSLVLRLWRPATLKIRELDLVESILKLDPPDRIHRDTKRLFLDLLVDGRKLRSVSRKLATFRDELGSSCDELYGYFMWLRNELSRLARTAATPAAVDTEEARETRTSLRSGINVAPSSASTLGASIGEEAVEVGLPNAFVKDGEAWRITFGGRSKSYRNSKGLERLRLLLQRQGKEVSVEELVGTRALSRGEPVNDEPARRQLRQREEELRAIVDSGRDPAEIAEAREELDQLQTRVRADTTLRGKSRRLGDDAQRAASAVGQSLVRAIKQIAKELPDCAEHLRGAIKGRASSSPAYRPSDRVDWML